MSDDERPKKSWREIDKGREGSSHRKTRTDPGERAKERASKTAAYSKYKNQLDKLWTGGGELPDSLKEKLGPASKETEARKKLLADLKSNPSPKTLANFVKEGHELPDDVRLLMSLLEVRDEPLLRTVLQRLKELILEGNKPNRALLGQRLTSIEVLAEDEETLEVVQELKQAL